MKQLELPDNKELPFLAYGSFKPGELRFKLIESFVASTKPIKILGIIKEKDGVPLFYSVQSEPYGCIDYAAVEISFY